MELAVLKIVKRNLVCTISISCENCLFGCTECFAFHEILEYNVLNEDFATPGASGLYFVNRQGRCAFRMKLFSFLVV